MKVHLMLPEGAQTPENLLVLARDAWADAALEKGWITKSQAGAYTESLQQLLSRFTADMAFLVQPASEDRVEALCAAGGVGDKIGPEDRLLILAPRPWEGSDRHLADFAAAAVHAARTYGLKPLLLAMEPGKDLAVCQRIAELALEQAQVSCPVLAATQDASAVVGLIRRADAVLGMRLHSLIFAAAQGTPFAGVSYDPKVAGFMDYMGQGRCCTLEEADAERLCAMVDGLLQASGEDFRAAAQHLRALAAENCEEALGLISGERKREN